MWTVPAATGEKQQPSRPDIQEKIETKIGFSTSTITNVLEEMTAAYGGLRKSGVRFVFGWLAVYPAG